MNELSESTESSLWSRVPPVFQAVVLFIVAIWVVEIVDSVMLGDRLQGNGIGPRRVDGLDGIVWAPFLHGGWRHLISNTFPFVLLGGLVALRGARYWFTTFAIVVVLGGAMTWLFAGGSNHIGASGVVFGFFGSLIGAAIFERRLAAGARALVAIILYGGIIQGLAPRPGISWEGHLFGAVAGLVAAKILAGPREARPLLPEPPLDDPYWEV